MGDCGGVQRVMAVIANGLSADYEVTMISLDTVSYTHLDVYKRQAIFIAVFDFILCRDRDKSVSFMQI